MFHNSRHRTAVSLAGPFATTFSCQAERQWEVRVFFLEGSTSKMFEVKWPSGKEASRGDLKLLEENVRTYRVELLEEWERKVRPQ